MFLVPPSRERIISFELFRERSLPPLNETLKGKDDLVLTRAERGYNREFTKSASPSPYIYIYIYSPFYTLTIPRNSHFSGKARTAIVAISCRDATDPQLALITRHGGKRGWRRAVFEGWIRRLINQRDENTACFFPFSLSFFIVLSVRERERGEEIGVKSLLVIGGVKTNGSP